MEAVNDKHLLRSHPKPPPFYFEKETFDFLPQPSSTSKSVRFTLGEEGTLAAKDYRRAANNNTNNVKKGGALHHVANGSLTFHRAGLRRELAKSASSSSEEEVPGGFQRRPPTRRSPKKAAPPPPPMPATPVETAAVEVHKEE